MQCGRGISCARTGCRPRGWNHTASNGLAAATRITRVRDCCLSLRSRTRAYSQPPSPGCLHEPVRHALPDTDEASQVPCKELLHVHKVFDCARFFPCKPIRHGTMLPSLPQNEIGTSEFDPFRSSILGPWSPL